MLEAIAVGVRRQGRHVLADASLTLGSGEVVAVLGPNGAGKSTLLATLSGALQPDDGAVSLDGVPLARWAASDLARRRAVLAQHALLGFPLTVLEVVLMGRGPASGAGHRAIDVAMAERALQQAGVADLAGRIYTTLSGGERQRAQFARVMVQIDGPVADCPLEGRFLMLDEPTSSLDLPHQHGCLTVARDYARRGAGVLVVLHDLNLAAMYADRICLMNQGRIVKDGRPADVLTAPLLEEVFGLRLRVQPHPTRDCPCVLAA